jgi:phosphotransferase system enzyme I (PtsI)
VGLCHCKAYDLDRAKIGRVARDEVEHELNRFHQALADSNSELEALKESLRGRVPADHVRILDTHCAYLRDSVFLSDVENLILNEQMSLEGSIAKVIGDFDRIFRLVQSDVLRERAVDLRDVGIRVLRNLRDEETAEDAEPKGDYILVAHELSIVDLFSAVGSHVLGIVTEAGSMTSHAAILARSLRVPTLTSVPDLLHTVKEGDFLVVDASEGTLRVNPEERVREQYLAARDEADAEQDAPEWATGPYLTADGETVEVRASCASLPEVERAAELGMDGLGLYRTELTFLVEKQLPSVESLTAHYAGVIEQSRGKAITFRLLDVNSSLGLEYLYDAREPNPALGRAGVRILLEKERVLRRQLQALLRASADATQQTTPHPALRLALPFVTDTGDIRRVKEILFEERLALRKAGTTPQDRVELGIVIETPVAALGVEALAAESDFLMIGLDSLQQFLLAADRENGDLRAFFDCLHPVVLRVVQDVYSACVAAGKPLSVFGVTSIYPRNISLLIGAGLRSFCVPPAGLHEFLLTLATTDARGAEREALRRMEAGSGQEARAQREPRERVQDFRHGYGGRS